MSKEAIYDAQIAPLMDQVISIAQANGIAFVASFALPSAVDPHLECTSSTLDAECNRPAHHARALTLLFGGASLPAGNVRRLH